MTKPILIPEQTQVKELREKQAKTAKEVQEVLDKHGMTMQVAQTMIIIPKK